MDEIQNYEQLFMLEMLVENLKVSNPTLTDLHETIFCISVKFGSLPCFELCHDTEKPGDDDTDSRTSGGKTEMTYLWNQGKSCVFSMDPSALARMLKETPLMLVLRRKLQPNSSEAEVIGKVQVPLGDAMVRIAHDAARWLAADPVSESVQDRFFITDPHGSDAGTIELTVRLTCLGTAVLTNFQVSADHKFRFGKDDRSLQPSCKVCAPGRVIIREEEIDPTKQQQGQQPQFQDPSLLLANTLETLCPPLVSKPQVEVGNRKGSTRIKADNNARSRVQPPKCDRTRYRTEPQPIESRKRRCQRSLRFLPGPAVHHPGIVLGHVACKSPNSLIPAHHGWAWTTAAPAGLQLSDTHGWKPGYFRRCYLRSMKKRPLVKEQRGGKAKLSERRRKSTQKAEESPTLRLSRRAGQCNVCYAPPGGEKPQSYSYPNDTDASDIDVDVTFPGVLPAPLPQLRHQAQQFCEEDFPPVKTPRKITKPKISKKTKDRKTKKGNARKPEKLSQKKESERKTKGDMTPKSVKFDAVPLKNSKSQNATEVKGRKVVTKDQEKNRRQKTERISGKTKNAVKVRPWDNWVMKVQCKDDLTTYRPSAMNRKKRKDPAKKDKVIVGAHK